MSDSFSEPAENGTAEPDVERDDAQVDAGAESDYVGRVAGTDEGYEDEQGAEARAEAEGHAGP
jgi:hypothetical protein